MLFLVFFYSSNIFTCDLQSSRAVWVVHLGILSRLQRRQTRKEFLIPGNSDLLSHLHLSVGLGSGSSGGDKSSPLVTR